MTGVSRTTRHRVPLSSDMGEETIMKAGVEPEHSVRAKMPGPFFVWLGGSLFSQLGDAALLFAVGWAATAYGGSWAGVALSAIVLPRTILMLIGGAVSDRWSPRGTMTVATATMIVACVSFAVIGTTTGVHLWLLIALGLIVGTADAFFMPAAGSMPRLLVGTELLPRALAMRQTGSQLITLVGAPLGGVLVASTGMTGTAAVDAVTFVAMLLVLMLVRPSVVAERPPRTGGLLAAAFDGLRVVASHPVLRPGLLLTAVLAGAAIPVPTLIVPLLARDYGLTASAAGLIVGAESAGAIIVGLLVSKFGAFSRAGLVAPISLGIMTGAMVVLVSVSTLPTLVAAGLVHGVGLGLFVSHVGPLLLRSSPDGHLSRVQAVIGLVQSGALLLTINVLGNLAKISSAQRAAWMCIGLLVVAALGAVASKPFRRSVL
jgi:MFS family permease